jgi:hypothetical protein
MGCDLVNSHMVLKVALWWLRPCRANEKRKKKPTRWNTCKVFHLVGLLVNGRPGTAGLPFI